MKNYNIFSDIQSANFGFRHQMSKESDTFQTIGQLGTYIICQLDDTVHEMARDEARHGKAFEGLLNRYFK